MKHVADDLFDPALRGIIAEAARNVAARRGPEFDAAMEASPLLPQALYDGKQCAQCRRRFQAVAEYVVCRICQQLVCRRKGDCKGLHHAGHQVAYLKQQAKENA